MDRERLRLLGATERHISFHVDGIVYDVVAPLDMPALRVVRDLAHHPRPDWQCEMGVCGRCESLLDGAPTRLCSIGPKRLDGAHIVTPQPTREEAEGRR